MSKACMIWENHIWILSKKVEKSLIPGLYSVLITENCWFETQFNPAVTWNYNDLDFKDTKAGFAILIKKMK